MVQQGGGDSVPQAVVFVHGLGHQAGIQLGQISLHGLFQRCPVFAAGLFPGVAEGLRRLYRVAEQHLAGGGEIDLFQRAVPALGEQVERCQRVDLVIPVLHTGGLVHVRRVDVHNVAPDAELARAIHLAAADIPGGKQPLHQRLPVVDHAGLEGEGIL